MFLLASVIILLIWCYKSYTSKNYMSDAVNNIPGPPALPLLGCIKDFWKFKPKTLLATLSSMFGDYGNLFRMWIFNRLIIMSADIEFTEQILASTTHITKVSTYDMLHQWLGNGLLTSHGKKWHSRRKIITPTFHFKILEEFLEIFDRQSTILLECLEEKADGQSIIDVHPYMSLFTLDVIVETAMGIQVNAQVNKTNEYILAVKEMTELMAMRFIRSHLKNEILFTILHPSKKLRQSKLIQIMHNFTKKVIEERRALCALLDVLLQATNDGQPLSNEDIREEVDTFMFEGHDTAASALSFMLYLLSRHPRVQKKILAEVEQVYGDGEKSFTLMNLNELKYMECVIKESLRLYPPVPIFGRQIKEDFEYKHSSLGNGIIPANSELYVLMGILLRDPKRYPNPCEFLPERYETVDEKFGMSSSPFSAGPRNCIGQKFVMYELKICLLKIIQTYELLPLGEEVCPLPNIVMTSENGMQLGLRKRRVLNV
ncbi:cytochrome P450 4d8 [Stomoxys calcitrans]|uniref:cytochrome P450 4d8 n=1 Tax=Stomoxys calcitrans TaxID=35570 RepID=UPI0027E31F10|nr:cytochrome P450 4d8 [Stomoxys calcitrans]XP_059218540.1 cytochrome P450 4d8 [Stomoxys calcitrans]XP_059218541.1 cytochrome P450 4d8 [Stomoxys calcitrans]